MPLIKNPDEYNDPPRPFFEHIVALRSCLVHALIAWVVCVIIAIVFSSDVINVLRRPAERAGLVEVEKSAVVNAQAQTSTGDATAGAPAAESSSPAAVEKTDRPAEGRPGPSPLGLSNLTGGFTLAMSVGMWGGTAMSLPFVLYFVLRFIFPALTKREKVAILFFLIAGSVLFTVGALFSYCILLRNVVAFFMWLNKDFMNLDVPFIAIDTYIPIVLKLILAFGLVFQIPLFLFVLGWLGVVTSDTLRSWRRFAIVFAFFLGMVLTPPDPMSQILMAVPLCVLYELSIWGVRFKEICSRKAENSTAVVESSKEK